MDAAMGVPVGEEGPCQRRLAELPIITLCWGAYGEGSSGVHLLVTLLASMIVILTELCSLLLMTILVFVTGQSSVSMRARVPRSS